MGFLCMLIRSCTKVKGSSEVMLGRKCKIQFFFKVVQLQANLICNMCTSYSVSGWSLVKFSFWMIFMRVTMMLEFPQSYCRLARGDSASLLAVFFTCSNRDLIFFNMLRQYKNFFRPSFKYTIIPHLTFAFNLFCRLQIHHSRKQTCP